MEEWKYNFKPVSKSEWLRVIEDDLKGKSIETLQTEYWPSGKVFPFHHLEDANETSVSLPENYFARAPLLMEYLEVDHLSPDDVNKKVLQSLQSGAESLVFHHTSGVITDLETILADVQTDIIEIGVAINNPSLVSKPVIPEKFSDKIITRLAINEHTYDQVAALLHQENWDNFRFVFTIPADGNWVNEVADVFVRLKALVTSINGREEYFLDRCLFIFEPDEYYFKQIMQTRALQFVWLNFRNEFLQKEIDSSPIEIHIKEISPDGPDQYLIRASSAALAASLTGVKRICIHHHQDLSIPDFYKRIHRNIHHLLNVESKIYRGRDPLAGSYTIDYYSRAWATMILEQFT